MKFQIKKGKVAKPILLKWIIIIFLLNIGISCNTTQKSEAIEVINNFELNTFISTGANSWVVGNPNETTAMISDKGIINWNNPASKIRTYFRVEKMGKLNIGLKAKVTEGKSLIKLTFNRVSKEVEISNTTLEEISIGTFNVSQSGYQYVELEGISKSGTEFAEITDILIGGEAAKGDLYYVKDDVYWGRRGPSVHLSYQKPELASDIIWFYNEVTVPKGNDIIGSYFMANGFGEGYFGMQVNSASERRFLFSVWSPFTTDNPSSIPEDQRVILLKKGENVTTGEFGNEGSGGQSYRKYFWKAGNTYKFLLKGIPSVNNSTDYTAYVFAPEIGKWELIASFRRPKTTTYLTNSHSFLENFIPDMGDESRKVFFSNQWVYDTNNTWYEIVNAKFTADATAYKESRLDYAGGSENDKFFLKNCGFFSDNEKMNSIHIRTASGIKPEIDFLNL